MTKQANKQTLDILYKTTLPPEIVTQLINSSMLKSFRKGEVIIKKGEICQNLYLIEKGVVRAYNEEGDTEVVYSFFKELDYFACSGGFLSNNQAEMNIQTIEDCRVYSISLQDLKRVSINYPPVLTVVYETLAKTLMVQLSEKNILIGLSATERYLFFLEKHPDLVQRIPLGYISAYLGMRQSSLSRVRREIHKQFS